jgi:hypothetical protein
VTMYASAPAGDGSRAIATTEASASAPPHTSETNNLDFIEVSFG